MVLTVSENEDMQEIVRRQLRRDGIVSHGVRSCDDVLRRIRSGDDVDAIVIDIAGCAEGSALCPMRRNDPTIRAIPVIAIASRSLDPYDNACPAFAYIHRPEQFGKIAKLVCAAIAAHAVASAAFENFSYR